MDYTVIYSNRRTICAQIDREGTLTVRAPHGMPKKEIAAFVATHSERIKSAQRKQRERAERGFGILPSEEEAAELKQKALLTIPPRVKYYAEKMELFPSAVKISSAVSRFGSCSGKNSLNFSYLLMRYPEEAIDYVIVHELAHIRHKNHGKEFYALIAKYLPDYKRRITLLKQ